MIILVPVGVDILLCETHALRRVLRQQYLDYVLRSFLHAVREMDIVCRGNFVENLIILIAEPRRSARIQLENNDADGPQVRERTTDAVVTDHLGTQKVPRAHKRALLLPPDRLGSHSPRLLI